MLLEKLTCARFQYGNNARTFGYFDRDENSNENIFCRFTLGSYCNTDMLKLFISTLEIGKLSLILNQQNLRIKSKRRNILTSLSFKEMFYMCTGPSNFPSRFTCKATL